MRVLLIEDDPDDALLMGEYLQEADIDAFELIHAERLEQAVEHLAEHSAAVDIALLDLNLPDSRGLETVRAVVSSDVPVIVVTGLEDEDMALAAVNSGAQDYLVKGAVDEVVLRRAIRYAIERHRLERERARLAAELSDAQKMKALGLLAGGIAHDFNNMLTVIIGHCRLVRAEVETSSRIASSVAAISTAGERAAELTKRLLALGREQLVAPRPVDVNAIIGEVYALLGKMLGEDVRLELDLSEALWSCLGEKTQLTQVLVNLAVNARDAMIEGGTLTIETSNSTLRAAAEAPSAQDCVAITVRDTGHGMDPATLERIFEPFYTTKERGVGTGLGLASVLAVVKRLGGFITVSSEVGVGTRFSIFLPRCEPLPQPRTAAPVPSTTGHETVLVVEDDDAVRDFMRGVLEGAGYRVLVAAGGEEAIAKVGQRAAPVHLLVTDLVMPGMNGLEVTERVLRRSPETEVILMSGYASDALLRRGMERGDFRLLEKPFDGEALLVSVRETLDRRESPAQAGALERRSLSVLVVDDDPLVRVVLEASLQREGHDVTVLASPEEVSGAIEGRSVDVVITDVNVPGGGAHRVLELIRAHDRGGERCPVVAISGDPQVGEGMLAAGCDAFYPKPIDVGELSSALLSLRRRQRSA